MKLNFYSLSSGSSGNCYYLGNELHGILIDAGISAGSIKRYLKNINISMESIMGILISHNHTDHIRGLEVLTRKHHIPVFTTKNVWNSILKPGRNIPRDCIREIPEQKMFKVETFNITSFPVTHDAPSTLGFYIHSGNIHFTIATDLGHICKTSAEYIRKANFLVIESNYDEEMLTKGSYPGFLKSRIKSDQGHLGNHQTSGFLAKVFHSKLNYICLAHLSKNNNTPEKALLSLQDALTDKGKVASARNHFIVLNRNAPTDLISLGS